MCKLADNTTAIKYKRLEQSIDWCKASDSQQIEVMQVMKQLLIEAPSYTPIYDWGYNSITGEKSVNTASEMLGRIERRIARFTA